MKDKRMILSIFWVILGLFLIALSFMGKVDEYWNGMGSALAIIGAIQLLRYRRLQKNPAYREKREIEISDERNRFIRNRAWAWAGYLFVMICAIMGIVFRILGQEQLSLAASYGVCFLLILYWISYVILKRKY